MLEQLQYWLIGGLIVVGSVFLTVGTVGLLRFDTVYNRMHATSKPTTLGVAAIFGAGFVQFGPGGAGLPSLLAIVFLFLTIPTGTHMIARSAERMGVPFRDGVTWPEPPGGDPTSREMGRERRRGDGSSRADPDEESRSRGGTEPADADGGSNDEFGNDSDPNEETGDAGDSNDTVGDDSDQNEEIGDDSDQDEDFSDDASDDDR